MQQQNNEQPIPDYIRGACMAYTDAADFINQIRDDLPDDLKPALEKFLTELSTGIRDKSVNLALFYRNAGNA